VTDPSVESGIAPQWRIIESLATGVAYGAALCFASVCLVASFRPYDLATPYWSEVRLLRTDTCGVICFVIVAVTLVVSEFLRLRRKQEQRKGRQHLQTGRGSAPLATAVTEVVALLSSGLVVYISVNAVTHPDTLVLRATHFATWPTEGTLRVAALFLSVCSVALLRYWAIKAPRSPGRRGRWASPAVAPPGEPGEDNAPPA
jgi:hypothetical protein